MQRILQSMIRSLSKKILARYQPIIVGITGSVGKTTTKEMIIAVLSGVRRVRGTIKSYNNELGVPLSIIGTPTPGRSLFGWLRIVLLAKRLSWSHDPTFPEVLVLEMGADHPGDIARLVQLAPPTVGVLTAVGPAHLEFYTSIDAITDEKRTLVKALPDNGVAVLNADDDRVWSSRTLIASPAIGVGFSEHAMVRAVAIEEFLNSDLASPLIGGIRGSIVVDGKTCPFTIPNVFGMPQVRALLAAAGVGLYFGMTLEQIVEHARRYQPPPGRMRLLRGIKHTILIDDSYNASPNSMRAALETLGRVAIGEHVVRYAVLGDMRELGAHAPQYHAEIGALVPSVADVLITVGIETQALGAAACDAGLTKESWIHASDAREAGKLLQDRIKQGDVVLFKGSQNTIRLERAIKEVIAEPLKAKELLVRQSAEWTDK